MVQVGDSQGIQAGDHGLQVNFFYGTQPRAEATASASGGDPLRVFVAMPMSTMGGNPRWGDISEIKHRLLRPVAARLHEELGRPVELVFEEDKLRSGPIHPSMFREAVDSDVYIADLTGSNANVFLELGVRWALKDNVTILISQDDHNDLKFNVLGIRVIRYGPMPNELDLALSDIVASAVNGLRAPTEVDSLVRISLPLHTAPRSEWNALRDEIARLRKDQANELVAKARKAAPAHATAALATGSRAQSPQP